MVTRINYGKLKDVIELPSLIEVQAKSYEDFLQMHIPPEHRKNTGLQCVFKDAFPVASYDERFVLEFVKYQFGVSKKTPLECLRDGDTYSAPLFVTFRLKNNNEICEEEVYMGEIPLMTDRGSFVINGADRVVVSQLHRSPGVCYEQTVHANGAPIYSFRIIPDHGSWVQVQFDASDLIYIYFDRQHRRRKFLAVTFLRAAGYGTDEKLLSLFYRFEKLSTGRAYSDQDLRFRVLKEDIIDLTSQAILGRRYDAVNSNLLKQLHAAKFKTVNVIDISWDEGLFLKNLKKDSSQSEEEALKAIFMKLRPGDPPSLSSARQMIKNLFFDPKRFDLGRVGRHKINQRFGFPPEKDIRVLDNKDIIEALRYLINLFRGRGILDDIDHLGNRRLRRVGELVENQCRLGMARTHRTLRERMMFIDSSVEKVTPQRLINPKSLSASVQDFFARSQLSQFMDQTNPLSELAHKRRLSALGPGGLSRERAGFEVRDVHGSHYGRICPIETPEGPNIGLISSLSLYAKINKFGFIETPYLKVANGRVTDQVEYLAADEEENYVIAQANAPVDEKHRFTRDMISVRYHGDFLEQPKGQVQYIDASPKQVVSIAAGLIPFLEHDDANRALMGSNMMRQSVPLMSSEAPYVATNLERKVALDSKVMVTAKDKGKVAYISAEKIIVSPDGRLSKKKSENRKDVQEYQLQKFMRSNAGTMINQHPIVKLGEAVKKGQILADGPSTDGGELALGRNLLVAFMPWAGYNFEDAIVISERVVRDDLFTSIHIEKFDITARDTKLGAEEITRDIPNIGEEALRNLGNDGVIYIGAQVKPGDILVGKITPKSETELSPEERLLRAIFGEKAADVRDTSLRVPSGTYGIVMDVNVSAQRTANIEKMSAKMRRQQAKQIKEEYKKNWQKQTEALTNALSNVLLGEKIPLDVVNAETGEVIIPANRKITKTLLRKLAVASEHVEIDPSPIQVKIYGIINEYRSKFSDLDLERNQALDKLSSGDEIEGGIIKQVKVYIASKKRLEVGDKLAGRHGNKGVVARIVEDQNMPFLPDGTPVDIILNPLGVPSRMNLGQLLETQLGWVCKEKNIYVATPVFDGISEDRIRKLLADSGLPETGKITLYDGRTGKPFEQDVSVGMIYMMKLHHLAGDKIHARAVGPYSLVTQQPLGGKAQYGGQRFGEMEVWALEAYSAAYALQEMLTVKSDDVAGRTHMYESIVKGESVIEPGTPESFNVLIKELQNLGLDIRLGSTGKSTQD